MADVELVIKMPKEIWEKVKDGYVPLGISKYLKYGKPLPKRHKRLIEDNFEVGPVFDEEGNRTGYKYLTQEDLNNALTVIEADSEGRRCRD